MSVTFCLPCGITLSTALALWLESNSLLGGGVELVVDAFVLMEKVALWYFVFCLAAVVFPIPHSCLSKTKPKLLLDFSPDKGNLWLIHVFPIKCSLGKLVLFVVVVGVYCFRG